MLIFLVSSFLSDSAPHPYRGPFFGLSGHIPGFQDTGLRRACWQPCCARALVVVEAAASVEPSSLWASLGYPAPAWVRGVPPGSPKAETAQMCPPRTQTTSCSWSATCASLPMCFCNSKRSSTPKVGTNDTFLFLKNVFLPLFLVFLYDLTVYY